MDLGTLLVKIGADTTDLTAAVTRIEQSLGKSGAAAEKARGGFSRLQAGIVTLAEAFDLLERGVRVVERLAELSDTATNLATQLRLVSSSAEDYAKRQQAIERIARETRGGLENTVTLYTRLARATRDLGANEAQLASVTETVNKIIATSGANAIEAKQGLIQFTQGLASGVLQGQDLKAMLHDIPSLGDAVAKGLGVPIGALRQMGASGDLTAKKVVEALLNVDKVVNQVNANFAKAPATIEQSVGLVHDQIILLMGAFNDATGTAGELSQAIQDFAEFLRRNRPAIIDFANTIVHAFREAFGFLAFGISEAQQRIGEFFGMLELRKLGLTSFDEAANRVGELESKIRDARKVLASGVLPPEAATQTRQVVNDMVFEVDSIRTAIGHVADSAPKIAVAGAAAAASIEGLNHKLTETGHLTKEQEAALKKLAKQQRANVEEVSKVQDQAVIAELDGIQKVNAERDAAINRIKERAADHKMTEAQVRDEIVAQEKIAQAKITDIARKGELERQQLRKQTAQVLADLERKTSEFDMSESEKRASEFKAEQDKAVADIQERYAKQIEAQRGNIEAQAQLRLDEADAEKKTIDAMTAYHEKSLQHLHDAMFSFSESIVHGFEGVITGILQGTRKGEEIFKAFKDVGISILGEIFTKTLENKFLFDDKWKVNFITDLPGLVSKGADAISGIFGGLFKSILGQKGEFDNAFGSSGVATGEAGGWNWSGIAAGAAGAGGAAAGGYVGSKYGGTAGGVVGAIGGKVIGSSAYGAAAGYYTGGTLGAAYGAGLGNASIAALANAGVIHLTYAGGELGIALGPGATSVAATSGGTAGAGAAGAGGAAGGGAGAGAAIGSAGAYAGYLGAIIGAIRLGMAGAKGFKEGETANAIDPFAKNYTDAIYDLAAGGALPKLFGFDPFGGGTGKGQLTQRAMSGITQGSKAFGDLPKLTQSAEKLVKEFDHGNSVLERSGELLKQYPTLSGDALAAGSAFAIGLASKVNSPLNSNFLEAGTTYSDLIARMGEGGITGADAIDRIQSAMVEFGVTSADELGTISDLLVKGKIDADAFTNALKGTSVIGVPQGATPADTKLNQEQLKAQQIQVTQGLFAQGKLTFDEYIHALNEIETTAVNTFDAVGKAFDANLASIAEKSGLAGESVQNVFTVLHDAGINSLGDLFSKSSSDLADLENKLGGTGSEGVRIFEAFSSAGITSMEELAAASGEQIKAIIGFLEGIPKNTDVNINVHTHYDEGKQPRGPRPPGKVPNEHGPGFVNIEAASGYHGLITRPQIILAGESGPEMVHITPMSQVRSRASASRGGMDDPEIKQLLRQMVAATQRGPRVEVVPVQTPAQTALFSAQARRTKHVLPENRSVMVGMSVRG